MLLKKIYNSTDDPEITGDRWHLTYDKKHSKLVLK